MRQRVPPFHYALVRPGNSISDWKRRAACRNMSSGDNLRLRDPPFRWPTSVFLYGPPGPLLNWVAWAYARSAPGGYRWTDVRTATQPPDPMDPVAQGVIPEDRLAIRDSQDLAPDHAAANAVITAGLGTSGDLAQLQRISDLLRLPQRTRDLLVSRGSAGAPLVLVVSNGHRLLPVYSADMVRSALRTLIAHGVALINTFPATPTEARFLFGNVWRLGASDVRQWRHTQLEVEQAEAQGPIPKLGTLRLEEVPIVYEPLSQTLDPLL